MLKSIIGEQLWPEMTEVQKAEAVRSGRATLKQLTEGLLDGSDELRNICREFLAQTDVSLEDIALDSDVHKKPSVKTDPKLTVKPLKKRSNSKARHHIARSRNTKQRFGLPQGFTPRLQKSGRSVLLEDNVYRFPSGQEFIPQQPTGTLGKLHHLYALLTAEQFEGARRGSVYVRTDGRIFDYGVDHADPAREMFDTGYTIYDLERTGRYAPQSRPKKRKSDGAKPRRLAQAG
jgi:hypothetical protein